MKKVTAMSIDQIEKKIFYHDTDAGGVVYYANYLKFFEEGRCEYLFRRGIDLVERGNQGFFFVVRRTEVDYRAPARYADKLVIKSQLTRIKNASLEFVQSVGRDDMVLVEAKTTLVFVDKTFRPAAMGEDIIAALQ